MQTINNATVVTLPVRLPQRTDLKREEIFCSLCGGRNAIRASSCKWCHSLLAHPPIAPASRLGRIRVFHTGTYTSRSSRNGWMVVSAGETISQTIQRPIGKFATTERLMAAGLALILGLFLVLSCLVLANPPRARHSVPVYLINTGLAHENRSTQAKPKSIVSNTIMQASLAETDDTVAVGNWQTNGEKVVPSAQNYPPQYYQPQMPPVSSVQNVNITN